MAVNHSDKGSNPLQIITCSVNLVERRFCMSNVMGSNPIRSKMGCSLKVEP